MFSRFKAALFVAVLGACSNAPPPEQSTSSAPVRVMDVRFVDYNRNGTLADHGAGTAYIFDDAIKVVLRNGVFPFTPTAGVRLIALSAGLAYGDTAARWNVARESPKVFIRDMKFRGDTLADSVTFWIRGTRNVQLRDHWLALTEHAEIYVRSASTWSQALRPIHGDLAMFR